MMRSKGGNTKAALGCWDDLNGKGKLYDDTGRLVYDGEYQDGNWHGKGCWYGASGNRYEGEWKDHKRHGTGYLYQTNGKLKYDGEWRLDERCGKGCNQ
mmetsp:Transcript_1242/g.3510  ORF Transcript_1242/g.3510 Transcript_1242/m.3510 type:complete len:98 (+) Transcript_1242:1525-1818(+)